MFDLNRYIPRCDITENSSKEYRAFRTRCLQATSLVNPLLLLSSFMFVPCNVLLNLSQCGIYNWETVFNCCGICLSNVYVAVALTAAVALVTYFTAYMYLRKFSIELKFLCAFAYASLIWGFLLIILPRLAVLLNIAIDYITLSIVVWNTGFTASYILLNDTFESDYMKNSALLMVVTSCSFLLLCIDEVSMWMFIALMMVWDVYAVSHPTGPIFRIIQQRQEWIYMGEARDLPPGLVYHTKYYELGTMDLILMAVIVGRGGIVDGYVTFFACVLAVIVGFMATCLHAMAVKKTVPALPAALSFGIVVYILCRILNVQLMMTKIIQHGVYC